MLRPTARPIKRAPSFPRFASKVSGARAARRTGAIRARVWRRANFSSPSTTTARYRTPIRFGAPSKPSTTSASARFTIPFINIHKDTDLVLTVAPDEAQTYASFEYYGGMVALRRDIFLELGGYRPFYFYMNEEGDYSVRLLNAGYYIKAGTAPPIDHHESPIRASKRRNQLGTRNQMLFAWYNIPFPQMLPQMVGSGLKASAHLCNLGHPDQAVRGFVKGWLAVGHELNQREPVSPQCYKLSREIRRREYVPFSEIEARLMKIRSENAM